VTVTKVDLRLEARELYAPGCEPLIVTVPEFQFLTVDGHGDPNTAPAYREAIEALYSVSYTLKFALKHGPQELDYHVMPLECLWSAPAEDFSAARKSEWDWTMMIRQPEEVDAEMLEHAVGQASGRRELPAAAALRLGRLQEGLAVQVLHVGPYGEEAPTIAALHAFMAEHGLQACGRHHEIYLSDPARTAPEKLRTIVRRPVTRGRPSSSQGGAPPA